MAILVLPQIHFSNKIFAGSSANYNIGTQNPISINANDPFIGPISINANYPFVP